MSDSWLVWGGGGHGRVVAELLQCSGLHVAGFVDRQGAVAGVIDEIDLLQALEQDRALPQGASHVALGIGDNAGRLASWQRLGRHQGGLLVHPRAWLSPSAEIGGGTVVLAQAAVHTAARLGAAVIINTGAIVEHDCRIDDGSHLSPGAVLAGGVTVGRCGWIGAGAVVLPGLRIGDHAVVGAGAVVTHDVPPGITVVGNPARPVASTS